MFVATENAFGSSALACMAGILNSTCRPNTLSF